MKKKNWLGLVIGIALIINGGLSLGLINTGNDEVVFAQCLWGILGVYLIYKNWKFRKEKAKEKTEVKNEI